MDKPDLFKDAITVGQLRDILDQYPDDSYIMFEGWGERALIKKAYEQTYALNPIPKPKTQSIYLREYMTAEELKGMQIRTFPTVGTF